MTSLVPVDWVAQRIGEEEHAVYRLAREGVIPCVRLGRRVKFDPMKVEEWIERGGQALAGEA